jgi:hypothetical protein
MKDVGQLVVAGAIAIAIVAIGLAVADNIQRANALEVSTPYSSVRAARVRELGW